MRSNDPCGFSLIEVMLAIVVLGMCMTVFFSTASQGMGVVTRARGYQQGRELLDWVDLREPLDLDDLEAGTLSGGLSHPDLGSFDWEREIVVEGPEEDQLFRILTRVQSSEDETVRETREAFLYLPAARRKDWVKEGWDE